MLAFSQCYFKLVNSISYPYFLINDYVEIYLLISILSVEVEWISSIFQVPLIFQTMTLSIHVHVFNLPFSKMSDFKL